MIWADKVALLWGAFAYGWLLILARFEPVFATTSDGAVFFFVIVGMPWIFMRLVDMLAGGPGYRERRRKRAVKARIMD